MITYKLTPSLYLNWLWWCKNDAKWGNGFKNSLLLKKVETTPAMQAGLDWENYIQKLAEQRLSVVDDDALDDDDDDIDVMLADHLKFARFQVPVKFVLPISDNVQILFSGRCDAVDDFSLFQIFDLKRGKKYDDKYKYYDSIQHLVYMLGMDIYKFTYVFRADDGNAYLEDYKYEPEEAKSMLVERSKKFLGMSPEFLRKPDWFSEYEKFWTVSPDAAKEYPVL